MTEKGSVAGALRHALVNTPRGFTDCNGYKCRQVNCQACYGDDAEQYDTTYLTAAIPRAEAMERVVETAKAVLAFVDRKFDGSHDGQTIVDYLDPLRAALDSLEQEAPK